MIDSWQRRSLEAGRSEARSPRPEGGRIMTTDGRGRRRRWKWKGQPWAAWAMEWKSNDALHGLLFIEKLELLYRIKADEIQKSHA